MLRMMAPLAILDAVTAFPASRLVETAPLASLGVVTAPLAILAWETAPVASRDVLIAPHFNAARGHRLQRNITGIDTSAADKVLGAGATGVLNQKKQR